jgi:hypothetical protein
MISLCAGKFCLFYKSHGMLPIFFVIVWLLNLFKFPSSTIAHVECGILSYLPKKQAIACSMKLVRLRPFFVVKVFEKDGEYVPYCPSEPCVKTLSVTQRTVDENLSIKQHVDNACCLSYSHLTYRKYITTSDNYLSCIQSMQWPAAESTTAPRSWALDVMTEP